MAVSALQTQLRSTAPDGALTWGQVEAAVEILKTAIQNISLTTGDVEIGAVELKNAADDTRAKLAVMSALVVGDVGLGVADPVLQAALLAILGATSGAGVITDANGTIQQYLRGLVKMWAAGVALTPSANVISVQRPAVTQVISTALEASHVLKASAGQLVELSVFNSKASAQFILLINSATVPGDGAVTLLYPPIPIGATSMIVLDLPAPLVASTGIAICNSSTGTFTKTVGSADCVFYAQIN